MAAPKVDKHYEEARRRLLAPLAEAAGVEYDPNPADYRDLNDEQLAVVLLARGVDLLAASRIASRVCTADQRIARRVSDWVRAAYQDGSALAGASVLAQAIPILEEERTRGLPPSAHNSEWIATRIRERELVASAYPITDQQRDALEALRHPFRVGRGEITVKDWESLDRPRISTYELKLSIGEATDSDDVDSHRFQAEEFVQRSADQLAIEATIGAERMATVRDQLTAPHSAMPDRCKPGGSWWYAVTWSKFWDWGRALPPYSVRRGS